MSRSQYRFFIDQPLHTGSRVTLTEHQSRQVSGVLRLRLGDRIQIFNGDGNECHAEIIELRRSNVAVDVVGAEPGVDLPSPPIHLALAIIKNDRFEWALQKITELGVERVVPITTERSVISLRVDREERRRERWLRIAVEASEQSGRSTVPEIGPVTMFDDLVESPGDRQTVLLWEDEVATSLTSLPFDSNCPVLLVVGPEGGFSNREVDLARNSGARTASLGRLTLRSETAAVAAMSMMVGRAIAEST